MKFLRKMIWKIKVSSLVTELTPRIRIFLQKLVVAEMAKKFSAFCGTRMFTTLFTTTRHWTLSRFSWVQSTPSYPRRFKMRILRL